MNTLRSRSGLAHGQWETELAGQIEGGAERRTERESVYS